MKWESSFVQRLIPAYMYYQYTKFKCNRDEIRTIIYIKPQIILHSCMLQYHQYTISRFKRQLYSRSGLQFAYVFGLQALFTLVEVQFVCVHWPVSILTHIFNTGQCHILSNREGVQQRDRTLMEHNVYCRGNAISQYYGLSNREEYPAEGLDVNGTQWLLPGKRDQAISYTKQ